MALIVCVPELGHLHSRSRACAGCGVEPHLRVRIGPELVEPRLAMLKIVCPGLRGTQSRPLMSFLRSREPAYC